jgi:CRP/FNR family transcriptional regulator, cyclic AMP receptor protein
VLSGGRAIGDARAVNVGPGTEGAILERADGRGSVEEARRLLGDCVLFRGLAVDERRALVAHGRIRAFAAGEAIFSMGSPGDNMMAVLSGNVRISVTSPEGKELLLAILFPGEVFGEIALLDGKQRTADATAMTPCSLAVLDRRDILSFLQHHPGAWPNIVNVLCDRLRKTNEHIAEVALLQLPARLAKALLRVVTDQDEAAAGHATGQIKLSQSELGNMVGAARESVNKCLRSWQREGIIGIKGSLITIANRTALHDLAERG